MKKKIILLLSLIPFFRIILKYLYLYALKKLRILAQSTEDILDILLVSNMKDYDFVYGSSDLNVIFIVRDGVYPKEFLEHTRKELLNIWPANLLVDIKNLSVLKMSELKTPLIRNTLLTRFESEEVSWKSVLKKDDFKFILKEQDHHNIQFRYIKSLEKMLLNPKKNILITRHWIRSFGKAMFFSLNGLIKYRLIDKTPSKRWTKLAKKIITFSFFSRNKYNELRVESFKLIDCENYKKSIYREDSDHYDDNLLNFCHSLLEYPIIEDVVLNPALIQLDTDNVKGKVFIDIMIGQTKSGFNSDHFHHLQGGIDLFLSSLDKNHPKYVFQFATYSLFKIKCEQALFHYPLEYFYRVEQSYSIKGFRYKFEMHKRQLEKASIQYLMSEFMGFRTHKHRDYLIGSRFIKSLNIIYRYQLLLNYLKGQEFAVSHSYKSIMEELSPQLQEIKPLQVVDEELWKLIRSQMLYILKRTRDELSKKNPSLKNLQF
jgi:hypothetical protein